MAPPELSVANGLTLRRYLLSDVQQLHDAISESVEHLKPWMAWISHEPLTMFDRSQLVESWIQQWDNREDFLMGVFSGDELVASSGLHLRGGSDVVEIGYWVRVRHLRQTVATRVVNSLTTVAFETWDHIDRVEIHVDANNTASLKVAERCGYFQSGVEHRKPEAPGESGRLLHWKRDRFSVY